MSAQSPYAKPGREDRTDVVAAAEADLVALVAWLCWEVGPGHARMVVMAALDAGGRRAWERKRGGQ